MSTHHQDLLRDIEAYRERHALTRSAFGELMLNDPSLISDLEQGRELRRSTEATIREKMQRAPADLTRGDAA